MTRLRVKMFRVARLVRTMTAFCLVVLMALFVPAIRNTVITAMPRSWYPLSNFQILSMYRQTISGHQVALSSCTEPGDQTGINEKRDPRQVHTADRAREARNAADVAQLARAEKWVAGSEARRDKFARYLPQMSLQDRALLLDTWRALHAACDTHNISHFLIEGSLLGAVRHRGLIPWDDDIDVAVHVRDLQKFQRALSCLPGFTLRVQDNMHWKFFASDAKIVEVDPPAKTLTPRPLSETEKSGYFPEFEDGGNVVMRYPFVDIFFLTNNDEMVWALTNYVVTTTAFRLDHVYPLGVLGFHGEPAPVPGRALEAAQTLYQIDQCMSPFHNHQVGKATGVIDTVHCGELADMYPIYNVPHI